MNTHCAVTHTVAIAVIAVLSLSSHLYGAASYFLSAAGSDAYPGTSALTPLKTIDRLNLSALAEGDSILFRCGDSFYGQLTLRTPHITVSSYDTGAPPVITGGVRLSGWTVHRGSIYTTKTDAIVRNLSANGVQMTVARFPNTGFLRIDATNGSSRISSSAAAGAPCSFSGGRIRIRTMPWQYETRTISSHTGSTLLLPPADYPYRTGSGFYLENSLGALDAPGEWYWDPSDSLVYFSPPAGTDPNTMAITASVLAYGVLSASGTTTIEQLSFQYQTEAAIRFTGQVTDVTIRSNEIAAQSLNGIVFDGAGPHTACVIDGNAFRNINGRAIDLHSSVSASITNNTMKNIGLIPGYGISGVAGATALWIRGGGTGSNAVIRGNTIDSTGYCGIRCDASNSLIEYNVVTNTMQTLADGGAIYVWNGDHRSAVGTTIRNNIVTNVKGDSLGIPSSHAWGTSAYGIYLDDFSRRVSVDHNTIVHAGDAGIMLNHVTEGAAILHNIVYECAVNASMGQLRLAQDSLGGAGTVIKHNIIVPSRNREPFLTLSCEDGAGAALSMAVLDSNVYVDPLARPMFAFYEGSSGTHVLNFKAWRKVTGQDVRSTLLSRKHHELFMNTTQAPATVRLSPRAYTTVDGARAPDTIVLQPCSSLLLFTTTSP